jgi:hypothetical protein
MSDDALGLVLLLIATAAAVGAVTAWTGVWRGWARQVLFGAVGSWPITLLPAIAAMCAAAGLGSLGASPGLIGVLFFVGLVLFGLFLINPRWWGPAWYRSVRADLKAGESSPDMQDPSTALFVTAVSERPGHSSVTVVDGEFTGEPYDAWPVTWIAGSETAPKAHALQRPGSVSGTLELRREGIVFVASEMEDRIGGAATVLWIKPDELKGAWAVAPGAGADGARLPAKGMTSRLARRVVPRLVVATHEGAQLFETYRADGKSKRIQELYELEPSVP